MTDRDDRIAKLSARIEASDDPDERERLQNTLAEFEGQSLAGDAHNRDEGGDGTT